MNTIKSVWFVESIDYADYLVEDDGTVYGVSIVRFNTEAEAIAYAREVSDGLDVTVYESKKISW